MRLEEESLGLRFESHCDPRLNFEQSLGKHFHFTSSLLEDSRLISESWVCCLDIAFMLSQAAGPDRGRKSSEKENILVEELASRSNSLAR